MSTDTAVDKRRLKWHLDCKIMDYFVSGAYA